MFLKNHKPVVIVVSILFAICIIYVGSRFIRHTYKNGYKNIQSQLIPYST